MCLFRCMLIIYTRPGRKLSSYPYHPERIFELSKLFTVASESIEIFLFTFIFATVTTTVTAAVAAAVAATVAAAVTAAVAAVTAAITTSIRSTIETAATSRKFTTAMETLIGKWYLLFSHRYFWSNHHGHGTVTHGVQTSQTRKKIWNKWVLQISK